MIEADVRDAKPTRLQDYVECTHEACAALRAAGLRVPVVQPFADHKH
jgi:hypothetical protein